MADQHAVSKIAPSIAAFQAQISSQTKYVNFIKRTTTGLG
jgi:hypothetical protein